MDSTTALFGPNFVKALINNINEGARKACQVFWDALISFLVGHWIAVLIVLAVVLVISIITAIMGRWGMLGKVFYNYLYFGILFIVGLIWGSDIFVSNLFSVACTIGLYPVCYFLTGRILNKIGVK